MAKLVLFEGNSGGASWSIRASGECKGCGDSAGDAPDPDSVPKDRRFEATFAIDKVVVEVGGSKTNLTLDAKTSVELEAELPLLLLRLDASKPETYRFKSTDQLGSLTKAELAALRARARKRLAEPFELDLSDDGFFGVTRFGTSLEARLWVSPSCLTPESPGTDQTIRLRAEAEAKATLGVKDAADIEATLRLGVRFETSAPKASIDLDLPDLPGFDLRFGDIDLPGLSFDKVALSWDGLSRFRPLLGLGQWLGDAPALVWTTEPQLALTLTGGAFRLLTIKAGQGVLKASAGTGVADLADIKNFGIRLDDGKLSLDGQFSPLGTAVPIKRNVEAFGLKVELGGKVTFGSSALEFNGRLASVSKSTATVELSRIRIQAKSNPDAFINLKATLETIVDPASKAVSAELTSIEVVEPYPLKGINAITSPITDGLIRLAVELDARAEKARAQALLILERIEQLIAAAAAWQAEQEERALSVLAGLAEALGECLGRFVGAVHDALESASGMLSDLGLVVEVRLDPRTYALRQLRVSLKRDPGEKVLSLGNPGLQLEVDPDATPTLVLDLGGVPWVGLMLQEPPNAGKSKGVKLGTDLWLDSVTSPTRPVGTIDDPQQQNRRLIELTAKPNKEIVLLAVQRGRVKLFQKIENGRFKDAEIGSSPGPEDVELTIDTLGLEKKALALLSKPDLDQFGDLAQKVEVVEVTIAKDRLAERRITLNFKVKIKLEGDFEPETTLGVDIDLRDLSMRLSGADRIAITGTGEKTYSPLGLDLKVQPKVKDNPDPYEQFYLDLSHGRQALGLGTGAKATLQFAAVSSSGRGMQFDVSEFRVGSGGFDLEASVLPEPVTLGGVDVPFRFKEGRLSIDGSRFQGASLVGSGPLPPALVGEANATIAMRLGRDPETGDVVVEGATARLDKSGDPIRCNATRFELTITELGMSFVRSGNYHFYFMLTGSAVFRPEGNEFAEGLLKNLRDLEIRLEKAPLAADARVLLDSISFHTSLKTPKKTTLFDLFEFELRGLGFNPSAEKFGGDPALSISGQVNFVNAGDMISPKFDFHKMWIAGPESGKILPRVRFDGLTVGVKKGAMKLEATAITVDGNIPDLYKPDVLPSNVTADGFLASGRIAIEGWTSMSAAMGFLELREKGGSGLQHAAFIYGQANQQTMEVPTPVGPIYLREYGFGLGIGYTVAGIARAQRAKTPGELIKILDDVSRYQGSLDSIQAWEPTFGNTDLTLALRGMFSVAAASSPERYDAQAEKELPNPLLFDLIAALRTDLTFLMNVRGWLSYNYHDWAMADANEAWKSNPPLRGYLYLSVPRKEFLGRFLGDGGGAIGNHPPFPDTLKTALQGFTGSATLYIRPGLFHFELGWPYELRLELGKDGEKFHMVMQGGLVYRIEDGALLHGIAFKATGTLLLEGRVGSDRLGAAAVARADFALVSKIIAYLSLRAPGDSVFYGYLRMDVALGVRIEVWFSFKIFRKRIRLSAGFTLHLTMTFALEAVISPSQLGGRAYAAIGVRAFGRTLSVGIGMSFNDGLLAQTRARVARFMSLGLATNVPDPARHARPAIEASPQPAVPRGQVVREGDLAVDEDLGRQPAPRREREQKDPPPPQPGRRFEATHFWAMLFPTRAVGKRVYVMQLVPRDLTRLVGEEIDDNSSTFFASPKHWRETVEQNSAEVFDKDGHTVVGGVVLSPLQISEAPKSSTDGSDRFCPMNLRRNIEIEPQDNGSNTHPEGHNNLAELLAGMFLPALDLDGGKLDETQFGDVSPRRFRAGLDRLPSDPDAATRRLARAARSRDGLSLKQQIEAEIEEARASIIAAIADTAARLAREIHDPDPAKANLIPRLNDVERKERELEFEARDFGLTFLVEESELFGASDGGSATNPLFTKKQTSPERPLPPEANFQIRKTDSDDKVGTIRLFNPPDRMFDVRRPRLSKLRHEIDAQGIKLDWDLEPAFGASDGVFDDPEYHLKHYRITRYIRGLDAEQEFRLEVEVKATSALTWEDDPNDTNDANRAKILSFTRPPFQFVDDLRLPLDPRDGESPALSEHDRQKLLGIGSDPVREGVAIVYKIVPVDIAGTEDFATPYEIAGFARPVQRQTSPVKAELRIAYEGMPALFDGKDCVEDVAERDWRSVPPSLELIDRVPDSEEKCAISDLRMKQDVFRLRILRERGLASGSYGSDALDEARRRPDELTIERLSGEGVEDYLLVALPDGIPEPEREKLQKGAISARYKEQGADGKPPTDCKAADLVVFRIKDGRPEHSPSLPPFLVSLGASQFDPNAGGKKIAAGFTRRFFLRREWMRSVWDDSSRALKLQEELRDDRFVWEPGEWRIVDPRITISPPDSIIVDAATGERSKCSDQDGKQPYVDSVVEGFEQPVHLEFKALDECDLRVESGRLHLLHPAPEAGLDTLVGAQDSFRMLRDAARRTAFRLEWNARPDSLCLTNRVDGGKAPGLHRWIGGFELYRVDPDGLPNTDSIAERVRLARPLGSVSLMPPSMRGLEPPTFGDYGRIESHKGHGRLTGQPEPPTFGDYGRIEALYPSTTRRLVAAKAQEAASGMRQAAWFSAAETMALFPEPVIRRSLMPDPDDALISGLFAAGRPDEIHVSIGEWRSKRPLGAWRLTSWQHGSAGWDEYGTDWTADTKPASSAEFESFWWEAKTGGAADAAHDDAFHLSVKKEAMPGGKFTPANLRRLLQNLRLAPVAPEEARKQEREAINKRWKGTPTGKDKVPYLSRIELKLDAYRKPDPTEKEDELTVVATEKHVVDLLPALHPVLADALAFLQYAPQEDSTDFDKSTGPGGAIYRRFALVMDDNPETRAKDFLAYLDEIPRERDPYGWGALRTLGLAAGLKLYDTNTGAYVQGESLCKRLHWALTRALSRYRDRDLGQPFVDLLTQPFGNAALFQFDGGGRNLSPDEARKLIDRESLAVVQISLRPRPDALAQHDPNKSTEAKPAVRYLALGVEPDVLCKPKLAHLILGLRKGASVPTRLRCDVLPVPTGIYSRQTERLSDNNRTVDLGKDTPDINIGDDANPRRPLAVLRVANVGEHSATDFDPVKWAKGALELTQVVVISGKASQSPVNDALFAFQDVPLPACLASLTGDIGRDLAFGKFDALSAEDWSDVLFRPEVVSDETTLDETEAFRRLHYHAGRRFEPLATPAGTQVRDDSGFRASDEGPKREDLADKLVRFWQPYIEHCSPGPLYCSQPKTRVFLSFGTVADPGDWRRAPDDQGWMGVTILEDSRRGARASFAVRPFGRYREWSRAVPCKALRSGDKVRYLKRQEPKGLSGAIGDAAARYFVDAILPRTEPLEKPVVLSSRRYRDGFGESGTYEVVVATGPDRKLAEANRRNKALLQPQFEYFAFFRQFPYTQWLKWLADTHTSLPKLDPHAAFGALDAGARIDPNEPPLSEPWARQRLVDLRSRVPDAWLGATVLTVRRLPYFFRYLFRFTDSAGVVVSQTTEIPFEGGYAVLHWPFSPTSERPFATTAERPFYTVKSEDNSGTPLQRTTGKGLCARLGLDLPAIRFIDAMPADEAKEWFGDDGKRGDLRPITHLPDPEVGYRLAVETRLSEDEPQARDPQVELLPLSWRDDPSGKQRENKLEHFFSALQIGKRWIQAVNHAELESLGAPAELWRIRCDADLDGLSEVRWPIPILNQGEELKDIDKELDDTLADAGATLDGLRKALRDALGEGAKDDAIRGFGSVTLEFGSATPLTKWKSLIDDALQELSKADAAEAHHALGLWAKGSPANRKPPIMLSLPLPAMESGKPVMIALEALVEGTDSGGTIKPRADALTLVLSLAPTSDEIEALVGKLDSNLQALLRVRLMDLAHRQLFGSAERRPVVTALRGADTLPITAEIIRKP